MKFSIKNLSSKYGFGHVYWRNPSQKTSFFVQWFYNCNESDDGDKYFFKIGVLKNFKNFTGKLLVGVPFNKDAGPKACTFIENRLQHRYFPVKIANFLRTAPFFAEHLRCLLLKIMNSSSF